MLFVFVPNNGSASTPRVARVFANRSGWLRCVQKGKTLDYSLVCRLEGQHTIQRDAVDDMDACARCLREEA